MAVDTCWKSQELVGLLSTIIDYRGKTPPKSSSGIPLISAANVKGGKLVFNSPSFISHEDFKEWTKRGFTQPGDVLITTEAPAGEVAPYPLHGVFQISRRVMALRPNLEKLDSGFLLYALLWPELKQRLLTLSRGTTVPRVLKTDITAIQIPLPPLSEQKAIASILGSLDDKIELNRRMNETLESMARAIFKSWFVDFDPVRAKMDGRQPAGMDQATADLFPDAFETVDGELVPKGWELLSLADLMDIKGGTQPPKSEWVHEPLEGYVRMVQIRDYYTDSHIAYVRDTSKLRLTTPSDVMIARYGASVGRICWGLEGAYNVALVKCDIKRLDTREYIRSFLLSDQFQGPLLMMSNRSAQSGFNKGDIATFRLKTPTDKRIFQTYQNLAWGLRSFVQQKIKQSTTLANLRDTLLPKLLSGELRVKDAEKAVSSAL